MLLGANEFFEKLDPKCCSDCDELLEELADCYQNICDQCNGNSYYTFELDGLSKS